MLARSRRWVVVGGLALAMGALALVSLKRLGYSTSWISSVQEGDVTAAPGADSMRMGELVWDLRAYRSDALLDQYRNTFSMCAPLRGEEPVTCVYQQIAAASPIGDPVREFVDERYDPARALDRHLGRGQPGHCTTRSALSVTALLAIGIPARVVQAYPPGQNGHNILEVFVDGSWRLFDPSHGDWFADAQGRPLTAAALADATSVQWRGGATTPDLSVYRGATVIYPEPWLYTRIGARHATWPFRGSFARLGDRRPELGSYQKVAVFAVAGSGLMLVFALVAILSNARVRLPRPCVETEPDDKVSVPARS